jgi:TRAP transporter 4TM/12TM fusion protein
MKMKRIITLVAIFMALFHLYAGGIQLFPATQQRAVHLALGLVLIFLIYPLFKEEGELGEKKESRVTSTFNIILALTGLGAGIYVFANYIEIASGLYEPSTMTVIVSLVLIILTLEASRRVLGNALPIIAMVFLAYAFIGDKLPLLVAHSGYSFERIVTQIGLSNEGIMGVPLGVSATYIVLFVVFGSMLEKSGAGKLFIDLALGAVGKFRGGAAKVSVVSSALFGSISGSQVANVATTGVLTIPLMKKGGYKKEYAAAVEATASTGGMFLPPIMGAVSFLIADFLQVDYVMVLLAALIPALLYFFAVFVMVDLRAAKMDNKDKVDIEVPDLKHELKERGHLLLPLAVLIILLVVVQVSPPLAGFWAIVSIPVFSALRKSTRMSLKDITDSLEQGVRLSLVVVAATACAGIVIGAVNMTGLGLGFSGILVEVAGDSLFLLLLLTMIASIIMGMGLPPVASYTILAVLAAPAITAMGVSPMAAHLFIFYFGTLSAITPPVAIASFAASGIAGSKPIKTSFVAVRLAAVAFIIPFMFVYGPPLIFDGTIGAIILATLTAAIGVFALSVALEGYFVRQINVVSRIVLVAAALLSISVGYVTDIVGILIIGIILGREYLIHKKNAGVNNRQMASIKTDVKEDY